MVQTHQTPRNCLKYFPTKYQHLTPDKVSAPRRNSLQRVPTVILAHPVQQEVKHIKEFR